MVSLDEAVIARIKKHGHTFEIYVDPDLALSYKNGDVEDLAEVVAADKVFKDAAKGEEAGEEILTESFQTTEFKIVVDEILRKGDLHLTTEQRKHMHEERVKQVVDIIARNAINPQTKAPHPPSRIEKAMEEAKARIDYTKSAASQVDDVLKLLKPLMPIKFEKVEVVVQLPGSYAGKLHDKLHKYGEVKKQEWVKDKQYCLMEIPGGLQDELYETLNKLTHGEAEIKVVR